MNNNSVFFLKSTYSFIINTINLKAFRVSVIECNPGNGPDVWCNNNRATETEAER